VKVLPRFEPVEQHYDGLNGKIIKWTLENGNTNHDPSILAFVVGRDGKVFSSLMNGPQYQAASFSKWALEQADAYEKEHPSTAMPFLPGHVAVEGEGTDAKVTCDEIEKAREAGQPLLLYFGRGSFDADDKKARKENALARKFEKGTLDSKTAAKECAGWMLLRFDLANGEHARLASTLGVEAAPDLLLWLPADEKPTVLGRTASGGKLAYHLKTYNKTLQPKADAK